MLGIKQPMKTLPIQLDNLEKTKKGVTTNWGLTRKITLV